MAEERKGEKIKKWDEVTGTEIEIVVPALGNSDETAGAGPAISRNPMRGVEDMVEQNDNSFDGVINNLPEPKPAAQVTAEDVIEEEQKKKSIIGKIREAIPDPEKVKPSMIPLCPDRERC